MEQTEILQQYHLLCSKIDAFYAATMQWAGSQMQCRAGCSACCNISLTISTIEAICIAQYIEDNHIQNTCDAASCPMLHNDRCIIYDVRPIICRSQGLVLLGEDHTLLPACGLNFTSVAKIPKNYVMNIDHVNQTLALLNIQLIQHTPFEMPNRISLVELLTNKPLRNQYLS